MKNLPSTSVVLLMLFLFLSCGNGGAEVKSPVIRDSGVSVEALRKFGSMKIFFGHQSVGANLISGLENLPGSEKTVTIRETRQPPEDVPGYLAHSAIGRNGMPETKLNDFSSLLAGGFGNEADIVVMKFCYLDIGPYSDPERVFSGYERTVTELQNRFPETVFVHMTVPLVTVETGLKSIAKRILGRTVRGIEDNYRRNIYNRYLREKFGKAGYVFDLAAFESTYADGTVLTAADRGVDFPVLIPGYSSDSGHLNPEAGRMIAGRFVSFISNLPVPR